MNHSAIEGDFFAELYKNNPTKTACLVIGMILFPINLVALYSIVWYERFGLDIKRNLTNQISSLMFKSGMEVQLIVSSLNILR